jgi:2-polyprenyl-6-hydroxyphenyl methylase / 3-demethylubiquinone-9 3-methyltransferase
MERQGERVNNAFYEDLGEAWYEDSAHPIALLRAENAARNPWILEKIHSVLGPSQEILDIGCGAGFLTNALAAAGHRVTGVDISAKSLFIAEQRDETKSVKYIQADAMASALPFSEHSFDVVCAMDFLEHVSDPREMIREASRLLKPKGLFFFHTFNRNWLTYFIVIKGVEWCVPNTPKDIHVYSYFIKPRELSNWCDQAGLTVKEMRGLIPQMNSPYFWKSLFSRKVDSRFKFKFSNSMATGYLGFAQRDHSSKPVQSYA